MMNVTLHDIQKKLEMAKDNSQPNVNYQGISSQYSKPSDIKNSPNDKLLFRIKEMEKINETLQNTIKEGKDHLTDVENSHAKFLSIVAHDLRSPFTAIIGVLDILDSKMDDYSHPEIENLVHLASKSAISTLDLLENIIQWSVAQSKEKSFNPVKIDLQELIADEFESVDFAARQKQITLAHSIVPSLKVTADVQMVKTIFRNLIGNAIKYSKIGGVIFIKATESNNFIEIGVRDNGVGITPRILKDLFKVDKFNSAPGTNNEKGTGFGLLFCKEFVEKHGGSIWVESELGKGSIFKFTLPHYI